MPSKLLITSSSVMTQNETAEIIHRVLEHAEGPLSLNQVLIRIPKAARPTVDTANTILLEELGKNRLHDYPAKGGKPQFWHKPQSEYAQFQILRKLQRGPQTQSEVIGAVSKLNALKEFSKANLRAVFLELQRDGKIHKLPPYLGARTALFSMTEAQLADYLDDALEKLGRKLGLTLQQLLEQLPGRHSNPKVTSTEPTPVLDGDERIVAAMKELNPDVEAGAMVSIPDLRKQLDAHLSGANFDRALLQEVAARRLAIHPFDRPQLISEEECSELLRDDAGLYYNTVAIRRN